MSRPHYSLVTPPDHEPLDYADAAAHLRVDSEEDQAAIEDLIAVAREHVESITGRVAITSTWLVVAESWAALGVGWIKQTIPIYRVPLTSVSSVKYYDAEGTLTTLTADADYRVCTTTEPGTIQLLIDPPSVDERPDAIQIEFVAGNDSVDDVPAGLRHAIRFQVAELYEERKPTTATQLHRVGALDAILENQRVRGWFA